MESIIKSIKHNNIFYTLFIEGFNPYIEFMKNNNIIYPKEISSPCELCEFLFKDDWFMRELYEKDFYWIFINIRIIQ
ncbi:hypothetical protein SSCH_2290003 [Syntrophaceticus schinkii]|uniref:Uncharacterized protein n=1 Tax=Syntrophaceticus schinkii TaxID=499207 RepID=A0A0B7ML10_9FIRM|nr:hypothetical protein SSCH_2290003 [Syntrophaceticus schinkii]